MHSYISQINNYYTTCDLNVDNVIFTGDKIFVCFLGARYIEEVNISNTISILFEL